MHEYVQKSTSTTLPRSESSVRGFELNQVLIPLNSGATPKSSSPSVSFTLAGSTSDEPGRSSSPRTRSPRAPGAPSCSRAPSVWSLVSRPSAISTATATMAPPSTCRTSGAWRRRGATLRPRRAASTSPSRTTPAPRAYARVTITADAVKCSVAATVATAAMIGPAHGVKRRPRLMPSRKPPPTSPGRLRPSA